MNQPVFTTKIQTNRSINYIAMGFAVVLIYFIYFFADYIVETQRSKMAVVHDHMIPLIISPFFIGMLIFIHRRNVLSLNIYNPNGSALIEIVDKSKRKIISFQAPFTKDFFYDRTQVSKGYTANELYLSFFRANEHLITLKMNASDLTPPPPIFIKADIKSKLTNIKKGNIYYTDKLEELIPHLY